MNHGVVAVNSSRKRTATVQEISKLYGIPVYIMTTINALSGEIYYKAPQARRVTRIYIKRNVNFKIYG
jgi:hypothetical protein